MRVTKLSHAITGAIVTGTALAGLFGCDGYESSFFYRTANVLRFPAAQLTTKTEDVLVYGAMDILWVVDNSGSMSDKQALLSSGASAFGKTYLVPGTDVRLS